MNLALHHNRPQIGLIARFISEQLYPLSTLAQNEDKVTFLMKFIIHKLVEKPSLQLVDDILKLCVQINSSQSPDGSDFAFPLDQFFFYIIKDKCFPNPEIVWFKLILIKKLIELSGDNSWTDLNTNPAPTIGN